MIVRIIYPENRLTEASLVEGDNSSLIGKIQKRLTQKGLYNSEINNLFDANTAEAVCRFQESENMKVTGQLNPLTYCRLNESADFELSVKETRRPVPGMARANILITKSDRQLTLFNSNQPLRQYPIAIGKPSTPTPEGNFVIATKVLNPGGVLGSRWMGLNYGTYGIHGTNAPWAIGTMVSHGCIRMHNYNAEELFSYIMVGTPVFIRD